ncbi:MAG: hypothetical protein HYZ14_07655 [Bacteroidetes bacterium]|nr:hypothetical protein [Bacteroidota bacterium]
MASKDYTFSKNAPEGDGFESNKKAFLERLGINPAKLSGREQELIHRFCSENLHNINWYTKRIKKETINRNILFAITILLLVGIPTLLFFTSNNTDDVPRSITVLLSSILAIHKFISDLMARRRLRSLFNETAVNLKQILYALHQDFNDRATVESGSSMGYLGGYLTVDFVEAISTATFASRKIVDAETQAFFDMEASPSYDIAGLLRSGSDMAKSILEGYRGKLKVPETVTGGECRAGSYSENISRVKEHMKTLRALGDEEEKLVTQINSITAADKEHPGVEMEKSAGTNLSELQEKLKLVRQKISAAENEMTKFRE